MLVSIILPCFNARNTIVRCLRSIAEQSYKNFELLLCNDCSTDGSIESARSEYRGVNFRVLNTESNSGGPAVPRNLGIKEANGDYIAFLDADDWWHPGKLLHSINYLLENDCDIVYHSMRLSTKSWRGQSRLLVAREYYQPRAFDQLYGLGNTIPLSSVVLKREAILAADGFSEERCLQGVEDYDLWLRLACLGSKFGRLEGVWGYYDNENNRPRMSVRCFCGNREIIRRYASLTKGAQVEPRWYTYSRLYRVSSQGRLRFSLSMRHAVGIRSLFYFLKIQFLYIVSRKVRRNSRRQ